MAVLQLSQHSWDGWPLALYIQSAISGISPWVHAALLFLKMAIILPPPASPVSLLRWNEMLIIGFCIKPAGLERDLEISCRPELNKPE